MPYRSRSPEQAVRVPSASTLQAAAAIFGSTIINTDARFHVTLPPRGRSQ